MKKLLLVISLVFLALPIIAHGADFVLGYGFGYSYALLEKQYGEDNWGWGHHIIRSYFSSALNSSREFSLGIFLKKIGFTLDVIKQRYNENYHQTLNGIEMLTHSMASDYVYFCIGAEYRFFAEKEKRLNPYINIGLAILFYLDLFGGGPPDYPETTDARLSGGIRLKTISPIFVNTKISYFPRNSILSGMIGLEVIF